MSTLTVKNLQGTYPTNQINIPAGHKIVTQSGGLYAPGHVLQVVQTVKTDTWTAAPGAGAYSAVTGFSASITPTSTSSKVMVMINAYVGSSNYQIRGLVKRDGNTIVRGDAYGSKPRSSLTINGYAGGNEQYQYHATGFNYLDSPATTSTCTYTLELGCYASYTVTFNRNSYFQESAGDYDAVPASTFTLMEIGQ